MLNHGGWTAGFFWMGMTDGHSTDWVGPKRRRYVVPERDAGAYLDGADADCVTVNVASYTNADAAERDRFEDGDLDLLYVAEAARRPELCRPSGTWHAVGSGRHGAWS